MASSPKQVVECPICSQVLTVEDKPFFPCDCLYQICRPCWRRIVNEGDGLCPACLMRYNTNGARVPTAQNKDTDQDGFREAVRKGKASKSVKDEAPKEDYFNKLKSMRVIKANVIYAMHLSAIHYSSSASLKAFFEKYGRVQRIVIHEQDQESLNAFVTYYRNEDATSALVNLNRQIVNGKQILVSFGTSKYCYTFLRGGLCMKQDCVFMHEIAPDECSFSPTDIANRHHIHYETKIVHDFLMRRHEIQRRQNLEKSATHRSVNSTSVNEVVSTPLKDTPMNKKVEEVPMVEVPPHSREVDNNSIKGGNMDYIDNSRTSGTTTTTQTFSKNLPVSVLKPFCYKTSEVSVFNEQPQVAPERATLNIEVNKNEHEEVNLVKHDPQDASPDISLALRTALKDMQYEQSVWSANWNVSTPVSSTSSSLDFDPIQVARTCLAHELEKEREYFNMPGPMSTPYQPMLSTAPGKGSLCQSHNTPWSHCCYCDADSCSNKMNSSLSIFSCPEEVSCSECAPQNMCCCMRDHSRIIVTSRNCSHCHHGCSFTRNMHTPTNITSCSLSNNMSFHSHSGMAGSIERIPSSNSLAVDSCLPHCGAYPCHMTPHVTPHCHTTMQSNSLAVGTAYQTTVSSSMGMPYVSTTCTWSNCQSASPSIHSPSPYSINADPKETSQNRQTCMVPRSSPFRPLGGDAKSQHVDKSISLPSEKDEKDNNVKRAVISCKSSVSQNSEASRLKEMEERPPSTTISVPSSGPMFSLASHNLITSTSSTPISLLAVPSGLSLGVGSRLYVIPNASSGCMTAAVPLNVASNIPSLGMNSAVQGRPDCPSAVGLSMSVIPTTGFYLPNLVNPVSTGATLNQSIYYPKGSLVTPPNVGISAQITSVYGSSNVNGQRLWYQEPSGLKISLPEVSAEVQNSSPFWSSNSINCDSSTNKSGFGREILEQ